MKTRFFSSLLVLVTVLLGACASSGPVKMLDGRVVQAVTVGDSIDRSGTYFNEYEHCRFDEKNQPINGSCKLVGSRQLSISSTVAGQSIVGAVGGTGVAAINYKTATAVAEKGKCGAGANCGTVITNQVQSVADLLNTNTSNVSVGSACSAGVTCK